MISQHSLLDLVEIQDSSVHGKGLFSKVMIKEGTIIGTIEGIPVSEDGLHVLWMNDGFDKFKVTNELKFINHHKNPNVAYYNDYTVVALKEIIAGSELLHDYGDDWK
jgi:hypothetical protein